jgi:hypothetical protein
MRDSVQSFGGLAGKKARCKKCGRNLQVPPARAAVAATGVFRMGSVQVDQRPPGPTAQAESKPHPDGAAPSSIQLAPISLGDLKAVAERRRQWEEDDKVEYELEKPVDTPAAKSAPRIPQPGRSLFWGRGGIAEVLLIALRKISDYAKFGDIQLAVPRRPLKYEDSSNTFTLP